MAPPDPIPPAAAIPYPRAATSRRAAFGTGMRDAVGSPALVLGASFVGFGSLIRELGLSLEVGLVSTVSTWALPAQVATLELFAIGAPLFTVFVAASLINFRFLPMTVALMPILRQPGQSSLRYYLIAHSIAVSTWVLVMLRGPEMPPDQRTPYFLGASLAMLIAGTFGTTIGFVAAGAVAKEITFGLVFLNPIFFMLVLLVDLRHRARVMALLLGATSVPLLHALTPTWGLLIAGVGAGTAAFFVDRWWPARGSRDA